MKKNKKHLFNLFTYLFCAFAMALFTIISFSCKTYAYTTDNGGIQWNWQTLEYTQSNSKITNCNLSFSVFDQSVPSYRREVTVYNVNLIIHKNNDNILYVNLLDLNGFTNVYDEEDGYTNTLYYNNERIVSYIYMQSSNNTYFNFNFDTLNNINYYSNFKFNFNNNVNDLDSDFDDLTTTFYLEKINDKSLDSRNNISDYDKQIVYNGRVNSIDYTFYYSSLDYNFYNSSTNRLKFSCYCNCSNDMYILAFDNGTSDFNGLPYINIGTTSLYFSDNNINDYLSNDDFFNTDTYSKQYYDNLQQQYNTLNTNYQNLQIEYNNLNNNYTQLQNDYNTLQNMYDNIFRSTYPFNKDLISIDSVIFNGQDITTIYKQDYDYTIDFQDTTISINSRDFEYLPNYNDDIYGYELFQMICTYDTPVQLTDVIAKSALSDVKESYCDVTFFLDNQIVTYLYLDNDMQDTDIQMITGSTCTFDKIVFEIRISQDETQYNNYTTISSGGNYAQGYAQASSEYNQQIQSLSNAVTNRDTQILNLQHSIDLLQIAYNDLNTSYQNMLNGNNFANLFFTIAETPFASFKQIWSVDFLGVNLAGFVTGILFIGVLIWVVKKIF